MEDPQILVSVGRAIADFFLCPITIPACTLLALIAAVYLHWRSQRLSADSLLLGLIQFVHQTHVHDSREIRFEEIQEGYPKLAKRMKPMMAIIRKAAHKEKGVDPAL